VIEQAAIVDLRVLERQAAEATNSFVCSASRPRGVPASTGAIEPRCAHDHLAAPKLLVVTARHSRRLNSGTAPAGSHGVETGRDCPALPA